MKRIISLMLVTLALTVFVEGCGKRASEKSEKFSVVTTIFPEYDWVMNILGDKSDRFDVTMLLDNGVDLHSYQPTADDIIKISRCDLFVYVGGESDEWVNDALKEVTNKNMKVINLLDVLGNAVKEEELKEGMEAEDEDEESEEPEYDEHIWLSLKNAAVAVSEISKAIEKTDSANAKIYKANTDSYIKKLNELDKKYANAVNKSKFKTLVFADRFPFRYLTDDSYIDLTKLSSTMVYSEVYNMTTNPSNYIGKKVKMNGKFALYYAYDENDKPIPDQYYFTCVIADATACCQQGLEFVLADGKKYPEDYPKLNTDITVIGEFQSYTEGENRYYHLVNAEIES